MKYIWSDEKQKWVEAGRKMSEIHYVQPDLKEFRSNDGAHIGGRRQWREHLKRTGTSEMGHSDLRSATEKWQSRKSSFADKVRSGEKHQIREAEAPSGEITAPIMSRIEQEVANRLDGRPSPDRKMLLKMTLETARQYGERRR